MNSKPFAATVVMTIAALQAGPAAAYVGPGAGLSAIGSVLAFLGVLMLMIVGFLWYPLKRVFVRTGRDPEDDARGGRRE
ncbi:hypothetical protein [Roseovarius salis]|uniref:hypothetical protein n=1 Tax=Roseovarius salis TaxID=3376063 RepID=UPI0037CB6C60